MAPDGNIQSLNTAVREALPHLRHTVDADPSVDVRTRVLAFSATPRWHVATPVPLEEFLWIDLTSEPSGLSELGLAVATLTDALKEAPGQAPPAGVVLLSDGLVTDTCRPFLEDALEGLMADPIARRCIRLAVGIGRDPDLAVLQKFTGPGGPAPVAASNPQQLVAHLRWASSTLLQGFSELAN
jgi:hypothetical protein